MNIKTMKLELATNMVMFHLTNEDNLTATVCVTHGLLNDPDVDLWSFIQTNADMIIADKLEYLAGA